MKKYIYIAVVLVAVLFATACGNQKTEETEVTAYVPKTEQTTVTETEPETKEPEVVEETVSVKKRRSATEPVENKKTKKKSSSSSKTSATSTEPTTVTAPNVPTQGRTRPNTRITVTRPAKGSFTQADTDLIYDGMYVYLDDIMDDVFAVLGDDFDAEELSAHVMQYENDSFILTARTSGGEERLKNLTITSGGIKTQKGAEVGMYATKVRTIYGDPIASNDTMLVYESGGKRMIIQHENNVVTSITYKFS